MYHFHLVGGASTKLRTLNASRVKPIGRSCCFVIITLRVDRVALPFPKIKKRQIKKCAHQVFEVKHTAQENKASTIFTKNQMRTLSSLYQANKSYNMTGHFHEHQRYLGTCILTSFSGFLKTEFLHQSRKNVLMF